MKDVALFLNFSFVISVIFAVIAGVLIFNRSFKVDMTERFIRSIIPFFLIVFFGLLLQKFLAPHNTWISDRLASAFAITHGYKIYCGKEIFGPIFNPVYPPVGFLAYWPATIFLNPVLGIFIAQLLAIALLFIPVVLAIFWFKNKSDYNVWSGILSFIYFTVLIFYLHPLIDIAFCPHVDAPAIGFAALACLFLYGSKHNKHPIRYFFLSSLCVVLAVWSKQVMIMLAIALPCYVLLSAGWKKFAIYSICLVMASGLLLLIFGSIFKISNLFFDLVIVLSRHPWVDANRMRAFAKATEELFGYCLLPLVVILFCIIDSLSKDKMNLRKWFERNDWSIFLFAGIFLVPTSILGRAKLGGAVDALGFATYFFAAASALSLNFKTHKLGIGAREKIVLSIVILLSFIKAISLGNFQDKVNTLKNNPVAVSYRYIRNHPGEAYFPWNQLSHLMAEGKAYHGYAGVLGLEWGGYLLSDDEFRKYVPLKAKIIAFPPDIVSGSGDPTNGMVVMVMRHMPEYGKKVKLPELPGWVVYERE